MDGVDDCGQLGDTRIELRLRHTDPDTGTEPDVGQAWIVIRRTFRSSSFFVVSERFSIGISRGRACTKGATARLR